MTNPRTKYFKSIITAFPALHNLATKPQKKTWVKVGHIGWDFNQLLQKEDKVVIEVKRERITALIYPDGGFSRPVHPKMTAEVDWDRALFSKVES